MRKNTYISGKGLHTYISCKGLNMYLSSKGLNMYIRGKGFIKYPQAGASLDIRARLKKTHPKPKYVTCVFRILFSLKRYKGNNVTPKLKLNLLNKTYR